MPVGCHARPWWIGLSRFKYACVVHKRHLPALDTFATAQFERESCLVLHEFVIIESESVDTIAAICAVQSLRTGVAVFPVATVFAVSPIYAVAAIFAILAVPP